MVIVPLQYFYIHKMEFSGLQEMLPVAHSVLLLYIGTSLQIEYEIASDVHSINGM